MKTLKKYYAESKKKLICYCIPLWLILLHMCFALNVIFADIMMGFAQKNTVTVILNHMDFFKYLLSLAIGFCSPTGITIAIYYVVLNYINKKRWKKRFPEFDISGTWIDNSYYTRKLGEKGWEQLRNEAVPAPVIIEQTCESVSVKMSVGEDFRWYSLLAVWNDNNELEIFYRADYYTRLQEKGYPEFRIGYECMSVCTEALDEEKRPCKMKGKFWHCISYDGKPMYMGDVIYERGYEDRSSEITI